MEQLLRRELEGIFFEEAEAEYRLGDPFKLGWSTYDYSVFDSRFIDEKNLVNYRHLPDYFNKEVAVYFECGDRFSNSNKRSLARFIYRESALIHSGRPPLQRCHCIAQDISFDEKCALRPQGIAEISAFHRRLCDAATQFLEVPVTRRFAYSHGRFTTNPTKETQSYKEHGFSLGHLFRALLIVVDKEVGADILPGPYFGGLPYEALTDSTIKDTNRVAEWKTAQYTVLLVKTADDTHLSAPTSFQPLFDSGSALPANREDDTDSIVRVKIGVAIQFVFDLLRREQEFLPQVRQGAEELAEELRQGCAKWVDAVLENSL